MARVDWITWKTETKEIINNETILDSLNKSINELNSILDNVYNNIKLEIDKGGLNNEALSLNGESPSMILSNKVLNNIEDIKAIEERLLDRINKQLLEQKKIEKEQLIDSISKKINEQDKILENTEALKNRITAENNVININEVNNTINVTKEKLNMLHERLEKAKAI